MSSINNQNRLKIKLVFGLGTTLKGSLKGEISNVENQKPALT